MKGKANGIEIDKLKRLENITISRPIGYHRAKNVCF